MFENDGHESFIDQPAPGEKVWRYMDLARYISVLEKRALHFARVDQMTDAWEGSYGPRNLALGPDVYGEHFEMMRSVSAARRRFMRERFHMSCWHLAEVESAAMWALYQRDGRGVAIQSTWGALTSSITSTRQVFGARVKYADYTKTFIPEGNAFDAFLYKRESFSHEREVRLLTMTGVMGSPNGENGGTVDLGPEPPVIPVSVNLADLVQEVFVAPNEPDWIGDLVRSVTARYGFTFSVRHSDLSKDPIE